MDHPSNWGNVLFDEMAIPGGKKGKTGAYGTGADILENLVDQGYELPKKDVGLAPACQT